MSKRGNGEGSPRQRIGGRWEIQYMDGYKADGKPRKKSFYGKTRGEVVEKYNAFREAKKRGEYVEPSRITVGAWLDEWFTVYGVRCWKQSTAHTHYISINSKIKPELGSIRLQKLSTPQIQKYVNKLDAEGCAASYISKIFEPLKAALKKAVEIGYINRNPAEFVKKPLRKQPQVRFLDAAEQDALLNVLPDTTEGLAIRFILNTGLRVGELSGLRKKDQPGHGHNPQHMPIL